MKRILIALACIFFLSTLCFGQSEIDRCEALVPSGLKTAIKKDYPTYRIARVSDYPTETIKDQRGVYPNHPCLAVASTDVDGDGFNDYALFIVEPSGHTLLIAGRNIGGKIWQLSTLDDFGKGELGISYVDTIKAGKYQDLYAYSPEYEIESGRVKQFKSTRPGFIAGTIESSGIAFFFSGKSWVHLCLSD